MSISLEIGLWFIFFVLSVFFSGMDMAFIDSDKLQFAISRKNKGVYNFMLNSIYGHPREFLAAMMIGKITTAVLLVYFTILIIGSVFGSYFNPDWFIVFFAIIFLTLIIIFSIFIVVVEIILCSKLKNIQINKIIRGDNYDSNRNE